VWLNASKGAALSLPIGACYTAMGYRVDSFGECRKFVGVGRRRWYVRISLSMYFRLKQCLCSVFIGHFV